MKVELIYDADCPNVTGAREELMRAFSLAQIPSKWVEWDRADPSAPAYVKGYGSPTILVDGKDVGGLEPAEGVSCCRVYGVEEGTFRGTPPVKAIVEALKRASPEEGAGKTGKGSSGWKTSLAALPGLGASLLPVGVCPACWPAYTGLLSSVGLGFLIEETYLFPLTAFFLLIAVGALGYKARTRRGYGPFFLGLAASALMLAGNFLLGVSALLYGGIALLVAASAWNAWPRRKQENAKTSCPACAHGGREKRAGALEK